MPDQDFDRLGRRTFLALLGLTLAAITNALTLIL